MDMTATERAYASLALYQEDGLVNVVKNHS